MKKLFAIISSALLLASCDDKEIIIKPPPPASHPVMRHTPLNDQSIKFGQQKSLDLDGDLQPDVFFSTVLVGDPILRRDRRQYFAGSAFHVSLLFNNAEETPALNNTDSIKITSPVHFNWYNANSAVLAEKIIEETGPAHWEGNWKNLQHKYLAVQIEKNNRRYNGWVELSFNTVSEEMILHNAAISTEAERNIKAGVK